MPDVLVIDDDRQLCAAITHLLEHEQHTVACAYTGADGAQLLSQKTYDLIILDLGLPDVDGTELCKSFRNNGVSIPIIMLTGRGDVNAKVTGLDLGADDYLTKPFHTGEIRARVRALLRRPAKLLGATLKVGEIELDSTKREAYKSGVPIKLTASELALLEFFMRNVNKIFSADALLNHVWKAKNAVGSETVRTVIKRLRQEIDQPGRDSMIQTVHGVGYRLCQPQDSE